MCIYRSSCQATCQIHCTACTSSFCLHLHCTLTVIKTSVSVCVQSPCEAACQQHCAPCSSSFRLHSDSAYILHEASVCVHAGPPVKQRAKIIVPLALAAFAYTQAVHLPSEQVWNGAIAAVLCNTSETSVCICRASCQAARQDHCAPRAGSFCLHSGCASTPRASLEWSYCCGVVQHHL